ncbi:hypothetical protein OsI_07527 [Oryza sativa Indica Group]|uniref:Uncharacterized protein n=1 Tax=Oryza sativa subsp. indica TaxID=39946 RepID=B8AJ14_ORYSI|nr:hypothetical protein OsI_07527 [Oryza sativa Indica Group]
MGAKAQSNAQIWRGETRQRHNGALARSLGAVDRVTKVEQWRVGAAEIERDGRHGDHQGVTVAGGGRKKWEVAPVGSHGETTVGLNDEEASSLSLRASTISLYTLAPGCHVNSHDEVDERNEEREMMSHLLCKRQSLFKLQKR